MIYVVDFNCNFLIMYNYEIFLSYEKLINYEGNLKVILDIV